MNIQFVLKVRLYFTRIYTNLVLDKSTAIPKLALAQTSHLLIETLFKICLIICFEIN